jgi:threonine/homoserine/homoserine lactone efflux protein
VGEAIGQVLSFGVGVALSPIPIIAVILMLVTPRARANGPAFVAGWLIGLAVVGAIVMLLADPAGANDDGDPATWVGILKLVLGAAAILLGLKQWKGRPKPGEPAETPKWMAAVDNFTAPKALGMGALLSGLNPKNLLLAVAAAAAIAATGISGGEQAISYAVFALIATIGVAAPVVIYFALGDRAGPILDDLKDWMAQHNAAIMTVLMLVIGMKLVGDGIVGLS